MIEVIILSLLCLAAASLVLRVVLFILDKSDTRLGKIVTIFASIGFLPIIAIEWIYNMAAAWLLVFIVFYLFR